VSHFYPHSAQFSCSQIRRIFYRAHSQISVREMERVGRTQKATMRKRFYTSNSENTFVAAVRFIRTFSQRILRWRECDFLEIDCDGTFFRAANLTENTRVAICGGKAWPRRRAFFRRIRARYACQTKMSNDGGVLRLEKLVPIITGTQRSRDKAGGRSGCAHSRRRAAPATIDF